MKNILAGILAIMLCACSLSPIDKESKDTANLCSGSTALADNLADKFVAVTDETLLNNALGSPDKGKLCQGQVYKSKPGTQITIFRAWNSTNPHSKFGKWWALQIPAGPVSTYRSEYEICYQWSPLDKLVQCTLKPQTKVVIGTGQSAQCSDYLSYPVSDKQQLYIDDAAVSTADCSEFNGEFTWK